MAFTVTMTDPCYSASTTIDLTGVLTEFSPSYTIGETEDVQQFAFSSAVIGITASCPALEW